MPAFHAGLSGAAVELPPDDGRHPEWLDRSIRPADDFFQFANGGWIKSHPIPPDHSGWGVDQVLDEENQNFIRVLVEKLAAADAPHSDIERKIGDFYASGMDQLAIDAAGIGPLQADLDRLARVADIPDLLRAFDHLQSLGIGAPWQIGQMQDFKDSSRVIAVAMQGGLGLPDRDYYLQAGKVFVAARAAYLQHVARVLQLLGASASAAEVQAAGIMALETRLARASMSDIEQRDPAAIYHPMTLRRAAALTPHLGWRAMFARLGHPEIRALNVATPAFFAAVDHELSATPLETWKNYLRWQLVSGYAPYLSQPFVDEAFNMTRVLTGAQQLQPRWLRVLRAEDEALGFAIGELYVRQKFPPEARRAAVDILSRVRDALRADLATLAWMTPATREAARRKLDLMEMRVGYPDTWRDYSGLVSDRAPYAVNVMRARQFEQRRQLAKIGRPVDRSEWEMTPQTVNAYYNPSGNSLNVPAGILQPPYFSASFPAAVNYGATGATIGHEMTHGFDDEGARFDGRGNLRDWWAPADLKRFRAATQCISRQFSALTVDGGLHVQGDLVTGEAAADLGGLILAWHAFQSLPAAASTDGSAQTTEFTPAQEFFVAFAHSWAGSIRPEQAREQVTTDPHPPAEYRTNATLANLPAFRESFAMAPGPMVKESRCVIW